MSLLELQRRANRAYGPCVCGHKLDEHGDRAIAACRHSDHGPYEPLRYSNKEMQHVPGGCVCPGYKEVNP